MQLPTLQHNITPTDAFGEGSELVQNALDQNSIDHLIFGTPFQVGTLIIGLVYILFIVRYWDFLRYFIISSIGIHQSNRDKTHINPAEQRNIEVMMIMLGVILLSLTAVRVCGVGFPHLLEGIEPTNVIWIVGGVVLVGLISIILFQYVVLYIASFVCGRTDIGKGLLETKLLYTAVYFVTVIPFGIMFLLSESMMATVGFWGMLLCTLIALIIFVKETFLFFVWQKISILHWFLYLCALEIFPLTLYLAPILRSECL